MTYTLWSFTLYLMEELFIKYVDEALGNHKRWWLIQRVGEVSPLQTPGEREREDWMERATWLVTHSGQTQATFSDLVEREECV